jgi:hypothetical protein
MTVSDLSRAAETSLRPPTPRAAASDVINIPEATVTSTPSTPSTLHAEFASRFSSEVIEHTLAVARHVLERSQSLVTTAAVEALARESLSLRGPARRP